MKNVLASCATLLLTCCTIALLQAQAPATASTHSTAYASLGKINYWQGGQPGQASEWNCAANWSDGRVPDAFSNVVIPDVSTQTNAYPVLKNTETEINSLTLLSGASLTITPDAALSVVTNVEKAGNARLNVRGILVGETASKDGMASRR